MVRKILSVVIPRFPDGTPSRERKFYISKDHKDFKKIIDKIKKSNQMSILLIDNSGNKKTISEISNLGATNILNKVLK